jgi:flagellar motor switch protein FliG
MSPSPQVEEVRVEVSGSRKAAILLMGLGEQLGAELIRQLSPEEIRLINEEISALDSVPPEQMISVFKEFEGLSANSRYYVRGGPDNARRLIEQAMGKENAQKLLDSELPIGAPVPAPVGDRGPFHDTDPAELAKVLREENPQTLALILANLAPAQAGPLMASLPAEVRPQVALRIALMDRISPDVFNRIAQAIKARLKASRQITRSNGDRALASILNFVDGELADSLLATIENDNQATAQAVRGFMFVFEDIIDVDKEGIKVLLARVDRKVLTMALKGTSDKIKAHFTQCMSQRSAEMLAEDMEALGPVRLRDVSAAQQQMVGTIRQLEKEGVIASSRGGSGGDNEYVV